MVFEALFYVLDWKVQIWPRCDALARLVLL